MNNLLIIEDFTSSKIGEPIPLNMSPVGLSDDTGDYFTPSLTLDPRVLCKNTSFVDNVGSVTGSHGIQSFLIDVSDVKENSKIHLQVYASGVVDFLLSFVNEGEVSHIVLKESANQYLIVICTELGIITIRDTTDTKVSDIASLSLSDDIRQRIIGRDFRLSISQKSTNGVIGGFIVSEIDSDGNGFLPRRFFGSKLEGHYTTVTRSDIDLTENPESTVTVRSDRIKDSISTSIPSNLLLQRLIVLEEFLEDGKTVVIVDSEGGYIEPDLRNSPLLDNQFASSWIRHGDDMQDSYKIKLRNVV